jgi:uncharacterized phage protein gp47/JayE
MGSLSTRDFTTLTRNMVTAVQGGASQLINLNIGSVLLAVLEAVAGVVLWLQGLAVYILTLTRAATSVGPDLDSWMADYGLTRLAATAATGQVTFSRFTDTAQAVVLINSPVQSSDGTQSFFVTIDTGNSAYNATLGGYVLPISTASVTVPVMAVNAGTEGNVLANSITSIGQGISGVDTVTNASAFTNGIDAELDGAFRIRFVLYLLSLSKATKTAIGSAIDNVQQGLTYTLTENYQYNGTYSPGFFYTVIDDGTGDPSSGLLATVANAIDAVRAVGVQFAVFAPIVIMVTPTLVITSAAGFTHSTVVGAVGLAVQSFINSLPLGTSLPYTQIAAIAYGVTGVTNVTGILLNGATADITANPKSVIKSGTPVVS